MNETRTYDFTGDAAGDDEKHAATGDEAVLDGWRAYDDWLEMLRKDLDEA